MARRYLVVLNGFLRRTGKAQRAWLLRQPELVRALFHRGDHERDVLVELDAEVLGALAHLVAVDARGEARLLQLLLDRLGREAVDAGGADERARGDEARQLVDRVERLRELRLARDAEERRVARDRVDQLLRIALLLEQLERVSRMPRSRSG